MGPHGRLETGANAAVKLDSFG